PDPGKCPVLGSGISTSETRSAVTPHARQRIDILRPVLRSSAPAHQKGTAGDGKSPRREKLRSPMIFFRGIEEDLPSGSFTRQSSPENSSCGLPGNSPPWAYMQAVTPGSANHETVMGCDTSAIFRKSFENQPTVITPPHVIDCGNGSRVEAVHPATGSRTGASPALHTVDLPESQRPVEVRSVSRCGKPYCFTSCAIQLIENLLHQGPAHSQAPAFGQHQKIADPGRFCISYCGYEPCRPVVVKSDKAPFRAGCQEKFDLPLIGYPPLRLCAAEKTLAMGAVERQSLHTSGSGT